MTRQYLVMAALGILAAVGGYFAASLTNRSAGRPPDTAIAATTADSVVGQRRPDFTLADASGQPVSAATFDGRPILLNFWATWCAPCVEEMPMLSQLQQDHAGHDLQVVGIAVDEPGRAADFAGNLGLAYPLLFGVGEAMLVGRRYGNASGMLPYSVLIDTSGVVRWTHLGALDRETLEKRLAEVLQEPAP